VSAAPILNAGEVLNTKNMYLYKYLRWGGELKSLPDWGYLSNRLLGDARNWWLKILMKLAEFRIQIPCLPLSLSWTWCGYAVLGLFFCDLCRVCLCVIRWVGIGHHRGRGLSWVHSYLRNELSKVTRSHLTTNWSLSGKAIRPTLLFFLHPDQISKFHTECKF
jgi:hypothetical protein